jgi:4-amino-4-deoxy-L-arabinose transferase-like glycosyltransferase
VAETRAPAPDARGAEPGSGPAPASPATPGERLRRALSSPAFLASVLALAAILRVAHVLALRRLPLFDRLIVDSAFYDAWARRIAAGDWLGGPRPFYMDPLFPYLLAAVYRAVGHDLLAVRLLQVALGVGTCALVAVLGSRVGGRAVGSVAALLLALYLPDVFQEGEVEKTALGVFLATAALVLATSDGVRGRIAAGAALGLASLARGNLVLMAPLGALWFLLEPGGGARSWAERLRGKPGRSALGFAAAFLLVLSPVAWRNHRVSGEWILTTSGAGSVFYTGNNPANATGGFEFVPFVRPDPQYEEADFLAEAERRAGRRLSASEASSFWLAEGLDHVAANPGFAATVTLRKVVLFFSDVELPDAWDMYFLARFSPVLRLPLLGMGLLLPLAAVGAWAGWGSGRRARLLVAFVVAYAISVVLFFVFSRYRLYVVPPMTVLAALALPRLRDEWRARNPRRLAAIGLALAAVALFSLRAASTFGLGVQEYFQSFVNLAVLYEERGDYASAARLLGEGLERDPRNAPILCQLGRLELAMRDPARAVHYLDRCVRSDPLLPNAWFSLGVAQEAMGNLPAAAAVFQRQLEVVPGHREAARRLAEVTVRLGAASGRAPP